MYSYKLQTRQYLEHLNRDGKVRIPKLQLLNKVSLKAQGSRVQFIHSGNSHGLPWPTREIESEEPLL